METQVPVTKQCITRREEQGAPRRRRDRRQFQESESEFSLISDMSLVKQFMSCMGDGSKGKKVLTFGERRSGQRSKMSCEVIMSDAIEVTCTSYIRQSGEVTSCVTLTAQNSDSDAETQLTSSDK